MTTEASAVTTVESASTQATPETPAALPELSSLTPEQRQTWRETGNLPKAQDSAPAEKKTTQADSSTAEKKSADSASDSATEKDAQKPHLKTKEDTAARIKEILDENKTLKSRLDAVEQKTTDKREAKQESHPAPEVYKPLDADEFFKGNPAKGQSGHKTYEDFVRASGKHEGQWAARQEIAAENSRKAQVEAAKEMTEKLSDAQKRYPEWNQDRFQATAKAFMDDPQISPAIKGMIDQSPVIVDLLYVFDSDPKAKADFIATCKSNPAAAVRKLVLTEQLVMEQLKTSGSNKGGDADKSAKATPERGTDGKFQKKEEAAAEPISRAARPVPEVGGRGSATEDGAVAAVKADDYRSAAAAFTRDYAANHR